MHRRAGYDQIADAGKPRERLRRRAHRHAQPRNLGNAARHQRRFRIVAKPKPVSRAGRERNDIFQRASKLDARHIVVDINAQRRVHQRVLHKCRSRAAARRGDNRRRDAARNLLGLGRAGKDDDAVFRQLLADHLRERFKRPCFKAL